LPKYIMIGSGKNKKIFSYKVTAILKIEIKKKLIQDCLILTSVKL